jgi:acetyl-CoA carboxylase biotin carboxyl carrier protein
MLSMLKRQTSNVAGSKSNKKSDSPDLKKLEDLLKLMERHSVGELEWEKGGERLKLRTSAMMTMDSVSVARTQNVTHAAVSSDKAPAAPGAGGQPKTTSGLPPNQKQILSPFVGTFYRASSPKAEPYSREGQVVKRGDVLCIIEAMKLMNEIEAEFPGKIISVLAENGQPVEFGEPLFVIET